MIDAVAIAIDGPAASGKSTIAKLLAQRLGFQFINSGAMYRLMTWLVLKSGVEPSDASAVINLMRQCSIDVKVVDGVAVTTVDGQDPQDELSSEAVNQNVSKVASIPEVRAELVRRQRELLKLGSLVMEGRDIGSAVFPDTPFKLFVTASPEVRASRRAADGQVDEIRERDRMDRQRKASPLRVAEGAIEIDSSEMSVAETVEAALAALRQQGLDHAG